VLRRRVFGPRRTEVTGGWRGLHNEEFHDFHSRRNITRISKSLSLKLAKNVIRIQEKKGAINLKERDH
jgi:hypothetical protein